MDLNNQDDVPSCRICHCTESPSSGLIKLISPCHCSGSLKYVHHSCLQHWLDATNSQRCELCKHPFTMSVKYKPLYKWGSLNASPSERRRLICNSVFNLVSMVCIFWSIYVLIERASLDARNGQIDWSFYVKISVVTLGLIIGVIFLFVQLKLYFSIFMKWRQSNRIIIIRNANFSNNSNNSNTNRNRNISNTGNSSNNNNPTNATTTTSLNNNNSNNHLLVTGGSGGGEVLSRDINLIDDNNRCNSNGEHPIQMPDTRMKQVESTKDGEQPFYVQLCT